MRTTLKEVFDVGLKKALFSNFSKASIAILEILDNSVSNRILNKKLEIQILTSNKEITIIDKGGKGMDIKGLGEFLKWGRIKEREKHDIGEYSQGGKSAIGFLGNEFIIITSPHDGYTQFRIEDFDIHNYSKLKEYDVIEIPTENQEGQTQITIKKLKRKINEESIKSIIIDTYRPLMEEKKVVFFYNGQKLNTTPYPLEENIYDKFSFEQINGWVGRLKAKKGGVKGGMRCYNKGRLVCEKEFFSKYDANYKGTLNSLFGEVHLDHIPVNTNKTDFNRDSKEWLDVSKKIFKILEPHINELLDKEIQEPSDQEIERVKKNRDVFAELMKKREKELKGFSNNITHGESYGQKPPTILNKKNDKDNKNKTGRKNQPKTPPPNDSIGKRRRLKRFMEWDIRPIDEDVRSIIENNGNTLVINNLFPAYKESKGNDLYLLETAAIQVSLPEKDEKISPQEYLREFDDLFAYICNNLNDVRKEISKNQKK